MFPDGRSVVKKRRRSSEKTLQIDRADAGTRTPDPIITSDVLYQLSYVGGSGADSSAAVFIGSRSVRL